MAPTQSKTVSSEGFQIVEKINKESVKKFEKAVETENVDQPVTVLHAKMYFLFLSLKKKLFAIQLGNYPSEVKETAKKFTKDDLVVGFSQRLEEICTRPAPTKSENSSLTSYLLRVSEGKSRKFSGWYTSLNLPNIQDNTDLVSKSEPGHLTSQILLRLKTLIEKISSSQNTTDFDNEICDDLIKFYNDFSVVHNQIVTAFAPMIFFGTKEQSSSRAFAKDPESEKKSSKEQVVHQPIVVPNSKYDPKTSFSTVVATAPVKEDSIPTENASAPTKKQQKKLLLKLQEDKNNKEFPSIGETIKPEKKGNQSKKEKRVKPKKTEEEEEVYETPVKTAPAAPAPAAPAPAAAFATTVPAIADIVLIEILTPSGVEKRFVTREVYNQLVGK